MVMYSRMSAIASATRPYAVAQVLHAPSLQDAEELELDVVGGHVLEERFTLAEKDRDQMDPQFVEDAGGECQPSGAGPVDQYVLVARRVLGSAHRGPYLAHIGDPGPPHRGIGLMAAQDEDRYAVVVVAAPAVGEIERPSADDDRPGGYELVHDLAVHARQMLQVFPVIGVGIRQEPLMQSIALCHR